MLDAYLQLIASSPGSNEHTTLIEPLRVVLELIFEHERLTVAGDLMYIKGSSPDFGA